MNVRFFLKGKILQCEITIDKVKSTYFTTNIRVNPEKWNSANQTTGEDYLDEELNIFKNNLFKIKNYLLATGHVVTANSVRSHYLQPKTLVPTVLCFFEEYTQTFLNKEQKATYRRYITCFKHFETFLHLQNKATLVMTELNYRILLDFQTYLSQTLKPITVNKDISCLRHAFKQAVKFKYVSVNPLENWEYLKVQTMDKVFLTIEELMLWANFPIKSEKIKAYRDIFTWLCFTGMYKKDLDKFREEHFKQIQGKLFIDTDRDKNGNRYCLPVHPLVWDIWQKYKGIFPKISEQKLNKNLKELAFQMGINKDISIKSGRKTFGNYMESLGVEAQVIADMMGHKSFKMTRKHYTNVQAEGMALKTEKLIQLWHYNKQIA